MKSACRTRRSLVQFNYAGLQNKYSIFTRIIPEAPSFPPKCNRTNNNSGVQGRKSLSTSAAAQPDPKQTHSPPPKRSKVSDL